MKQIFSRGVIKYMIYCEAFFAFFVISLVTLSGGGHSPFMPLIAVLGLAVAVASFPACLFAGPLWLLQLEPYQRDPLILIGLAAAPLLNGLLWGWYLQFRERFLVKKI